MRAGQLRHRIEIQGPTETEDGMGGFNTAWAKIENGDAWAKIHDLRGDEKIEALKLDQRLDAKIRMRYRDDVNETMRIIHGSVVYEIVSIIDVEKRGIMLEILAREVV